jgi:hypothetical protein
MAGLAVLAEEEVFTTRSVNVKGQKNKGRPVTRSALVLSM